LVMRYYARMRQIRRSALVAASPQRMFELINDVERYPEFVPGCTGARVLDRSQDSLRARLTVGAGPLSTSFVTRNTLQAPHAIDMELDEGPLTSLTGKWRLSPVVAGDVTGCRVDLDLAFELEAGLAGLALGPAIERMAGSLVDAFVARARAAPNP
jgi:ribosome-associated toxin RatA of RatAB toxin-antitoxin module